MSFEKCCDFYPNNFKFCSVKKNYIYIDIDIDIDIDILYDKMMLFPRLEYILVNFNC